MNQWELIICHKDMNVRLGIHQEPKIISSKSLYFKSKDDLKVKYEQLINEYIDKSYDWKCHSQGAFKFYHDDNGQDILTYLLVHLNGEEVMTGLFK